MLYFILVFFDDTAMAPSFLFPFASIIKNLWICLMWFCFNSAFPHFYVFLFLCLKWRFIRTRLVNFGNIASSSVNSFHIKHSLLVPIAHIIPLNLSKNGIFLFFPEMPFIFLIDLSIILLYQSLSSIETFFPFSFILFFKFFFLIPDDSTHQLELPSSRFFEL